MSELNDITEDRASDEAKTPPDLIVEAIRLELLRQEDSNPHPNELWTGDELDKAWMQVDGYLNLQELAEAIARAVLKP